MPFCHPWMTILVGYNGLKLELLRLVVVAAKFVPFVGFVGVYSIKETSLAALKSSLIDKIPEMILSVSDRIEFKLVGALFVVVDGFGVEVAVVVD